MNPKMNLQQLKTLLARENIDSDVVHFGAGLPAQSDRWAIADDNGTWQVYYFERGEKYGERWFADEAGACDYLLEQIKPARST